MPKFATVAAVQQLTDQLAQANALIQQQQAVIAAFPQLLAQAISTNNAQYVTPAVQAAYQAIVGATSVQGLYTLQEVMNHLATDETGATQLLAQQNADRLRITAAEGNIATNAAAILTKATAANVTALSNTVSQQAADIANRLPLTGGTLTGALNVMAPTQAANPLQLSNLPLTMTVNQAIPLVALGGAYSFPVTVTNAVVGQVVVINGPAALVTALSFFDAVVTAANTVTVYLKAGVAIAAGTQTFYLRVLR